MWVCCVSFVVGCMVFVVCRRLCAVRWMLFVVRDVCLIGVVSRLLFCARCSLCVVRC